MTLTPDPYAATLSDAERERIRIDLLADGVRREQVDGFARFVADELRAMKVGKLLYEGFAAGRYAVSVDDNGEVAFSQRRSW